MIEIKENYKEELINEDDNPLGIRSSRILNTGEEVMIIKT